MYNNFWHFELKVSTHWMRRLPRRAKKESTLLYFEFNNCGHTNFRGGSNDYDGDNQDDDEATSSNKRGGRRRGDRRKDHSGKS